MINFTIFASIFLQSNEEILDEIKKKNHKIENVLKHRRNQEGKYKDFLISKDIKLYTIYSLKILLILEEDSIKKAENALKKDRGHGTKMVLEQYIKWLDLEDENFVVS